MSVKTFAAIDIGSFELTMKIYEFSGKNNIRQIDSVTKGIDLGSGTYRSGKIEKEKVDELCRYLNEFKQIMEAYHVDAYKTYGTSAIRETENATIIQDQIKQRTGMMVRILSNSEQRFLDYKAVAAAGENYRAILNSKTAIVDVGGGSIQISLFEDGSLVSTQNMKLGVLRLQELFKNLEGSGRQMEAVVDEYASAQLNTYKKMYLKDKEIETVILVDDYISSWVRKNAAAENKPDYIEAADFNDLMDITHNHSKMDAARILGITEEKLALMEITAVLLKRVCKMLGTTKVWAPGASLSDGMAYEYGEEIKMFREEHDFEKDMLACALNISKRYMGSRKRSEALEIISTTIFDSMKKIHGLGKRERLYLQLASRLHDVGKYLSLINIGENSYDIIMATEIIGLSHREREIVANIVRFIHSPFVYYGYRAEEKNGMLDTDSYLKVAKLTAILRLANSLDRSHKQKLTSLKATLSDQELILLVDTQEDVALEKGFFDMNSDFFEEVYSIEPKLKTRKRF